eukprot:Blabericola_migrator_1__1465@NODE_1387_length_4641_cov_160_569961_g928_i0_p1_GENE_NODE_1387_length_4641_cov_160_569961_g928_i0NODE_1387_length_4641_cov_160_569961_g928_i0_p1_ORF_typecomplete_len575_score78_28Pro_isomerase/PF00160_21/5_3e13Pro_isomerase/PF00160_21/1_3e16RRM_1/PF00076_22/5_3e17RRM_5/PF13893_6/4_4e07Nup35_RRM_2/PF14605_6/0_032RL/PF17797_1/0_087RRM_7/PF16367_5/9e03RRM_7/PF16367_5/0_13RRM_3/PF08777_11/0_24_NODE_1387_length_4641_cov_160_569961_g928_i010212745
MSVILETTVGDLTIDLFPDEAPLVCQNFLKLCRIKYYNNALFARVERDFVTVLEQHDWPHQAASSRKRPRSIESDDSTSLRRRREERNRRYKRDDGRRGQDEGGVNGRESERDDRRNDRDYRSRRDERGDTDYRSRRDERGDTDYRSRRDERGDMTSKAGRRYRKSDRRHSTSSDEKDSRRHRNGRPHDEARGDGYRTRDGSVGRRRRQDSRSDSDHDSYARRNARGRHDSHKSDSDHDSYARRNARGRHDSHKRRDSPQPSSRPEQSETFQPNHPGGPTVWELIDYSFPGVFGDGPQSRWLRGIPDDNGKAKHNEIGLLATANERHNENGAFFYITLSKDLESLNGKHTIFGRVVEGLQDVLMHKINRTAVDSNMRPLGSIRIRHTLVVDDPFPDPPHLHRMIPSRSPSPIRDGTYKQLDTAEDELRVMEKISQAEARSRAIALEIIGDIPDADMRPPDNVLFICKLNPYTEEEDLETIFSQFGAIKACNIIKDWKTGDSLQYGFIEFEEVSAAEQAYFKMQDVLIDDRRIHVAFCQSVSRQFHQWRQQGSKGTTQDAIDTSKAASRFRLTHQ